MGVATMYSFPFIIYFVPVGAQVGAPMGVILTTTGAPMGAPTEIIHSTLNVNEYEK